MRLRWSIWIGFALLWTFGLVMPSPVRWVAALFFPGTVEGPATAPIRNRFLQILASYEFSKGVHLVGYLMFAVLSAWLRLPWSRRGWMLLFLGVHALATEALQHFQPTRHPSWADVAIDLVGVAFGLVLTRKWWLERSEV